MSSSIIEMALAAIKMCSKCKKSKSFTQFALAPKARDGRTKICKSCVAAGGKAPVVRQKPKHTKLCAGCELTLPFSAFAAMEWTVDGRDTICRPCRPLLKAEKGMPKYAHKPDLTSEEVVACRLMNETRLAASFQGVTNTLTWDWYLDKLEGQRWLCADTGRKLHRSNKPGRSAFPAMVARVDARYGFTRKNSKLVARI